MAKTRRDQGVKHKCVECGRELQAPPISNLKKLCWKCITERKTDVG